MWGQREKYKYFLSNLYSQVGQWPKSPIIFSIETFERDGIEGEGGDGV
jgi:hypothetical protein